MRVIQVKMEVPVPVENEDGKVTGVQNVGVIVSEADFGLTVGEFVEKAVEAIKQRRENNATS